MDDAPPQKDSKGRFLPGNSGFGGRPKGARNKLGESFIQEMLKDWQEHGREAIAVVREEKPDQYLKVIASILPKEIDAGEQTINILSELFARIDGTSRTVGSRTSAAQETMQ